MWMRRLPICSGESLSELSVEVDALVRDSEG